MTPLEMTLSTMLAAVIGFEIASRGPAALERFKIHRGAELTKPAEPTVFDLELPMLHFPQIMKDIECRLPSTVDGYGWQITVNDVLTTNPIMVASLINPALTDDGPTQEVAIAIDLGTAGVPSYSRDTWHTHYIRYGYSYTRDRQELLSHVDKTLSELVRTKAPQTLLQGTESTGFKF